MTRSSIASSAKQQTCSDLAQLDGRHRGQATVEFALILPVVLLAVLTLLDIAWLAVDQLHVVDAARNAARAAIVANEDPRQVAEDKVHVLLGNTASARVQERDGLLTVHVSRRHEFMTPVVAQVLNHLTLTAVTTMLLEPPITTIGG